MLHLEHVLSRASQLQACHRSATHPGVPAVARQVWRAQPAEREALVRMLRPPWGTLPPEFQAARAHHIGVNPQHPPLDLLGAMRAAVDRYGGTPMATTQHVY